MSGERAIFDEPGGEPSPEFIRRERGQFESLPKSSGKPRRRVDGGFDLRIVQQAKDQLVKIGANLLGVVLNQVDVRHDERLAQHLDHRDRRTHAGLEAQLHAGLRGGREELSAVPCDELLVRRHDRTARLEE